MNIRIRVVDGTPTESAVEHASVVARNAAIPGRQWRDVVDAANAALHHGGAQGARCVVLLDESEIPLDWRIPAAHQLDPTHLSIDLLSPAEPLLAQRAHRAALHAARAPDATWGQVLDAANAALRIEGAAGTACLVRYDGVVPDPSSPVLAPISLPDDGVESAERTALERLEAEMDLALWRDLRPHAARDVVFLAGPELDLAQVGLALASDDAARVEAWIAAGQLARPSVEQLGQWEADLNTPFDCLIIAPYVLAQIR